MSSPRILVACIGNIFLGDDGFGVEVAARLSQRSLPPEAKVVDFGVRAMDLTFALMDDYEAVILVDAMPRGAAPGTLYVLEVGDEHVPVSADVAPDGHSLDPVKVLSLARSHGAHVKKLLLVGCEPSPIDSLDFAPGLTAPVLAAVEPAAALVESLLRETLADELSASRKEISFSNTGGVST